MKPSVFPASRRLWSGQRDNKILVFEGGGLVQLWHNFVKLLHDFFPWGSHGREAQDLALQVEAKVRRLSRLTQQPPDTTPSDLISVLKSTCSLLDRLVEHAEDSGVDTQAGRASAAVARSVEATSSRPPSIPQARHRLPKPEPELGEIEKEVIKLRDWVSLATSPGGGGASRELMEELYRKLGQVLEKGEVVPLEDVGPYDYMKQKIMSTCPVDNPDKNNFVQSTVRPGYMYRGRLIRPQEVIVYSTK